MLHLAHGFVKQGLDVELVLVNMEGSYMSQSPQEVKVMHLGDKKLLQSLSALIKYLRKNKQKRYFQRLDFCGDNNFV